MPLYDYKCTSGHRFDRIVPHALSSTKQVCPECKAPAQRQLCAPAFALKGTGWCDKGRPIAGKVDA